MVKAMNVVSGDYAESCLRLARQIERFPTDTHIVFFNGEEYRITPDLVLSFVRFLRQQAGTNGQ
jgi:hypothetical protein